MTSLHLKYDEATGHLARATAGHLVNSCGCVYCIEGTTPEVVEVEFADLVPCSGCFLYRREAGMWYAFKWTTPPDLSGVLELERTDLMGPCLWFQSEIAVEGELKYWIAATPEDALVLCVADDVSGTLYSVTLADAWCGVSATGWYGLLAVWIDDIIPLAYLTAFSSFDDDATPIDCSDVVVLNNENVVGDCGSDVNWGHGHYGGTETITPQ